MKKKYLWHFVFSLFVLISLANIFQKLRWSENTDNILWKQTEKGLVCVKNSQNKLVKKGDLLISADQFLVKSIIDLKRVIKLKKYLIYDIERNGRLLNIGIEISKKYTEFSYYILAFIGIITLLLTLRVYNATLKKETLIKNPSLFYFLGLTFSGFLIFSPTGTYKLADFLYFLLDKVSFIYFPALLLIYSLYLPTRSIIIKKFNSKFINFVIIFIPSLILLLDLFFLINSVLKPIPEQLIFNINHFRRISFNYFSVFIIFSIISFSHTNLKLILKKKNTKFILPLAGILISLIPFLIFNLIFKIPYNTFVSNLSLFLLILLPISLLYFLTSRKFTDVEEIIKKTVSISSIFLFIFGIYFFLGINIEKNKLVGIFWSIAAILTAGLLFKPIENTIQKYVDKIFFSRSFTFKRRLKSFTQSIVTERDLETLSENLIEVINKGLKLKSSSLVIYIKKNVFYLYPQKKRIVLTKSFINELSLSDFLIFNYERDFKNRFEKDYQKLKKYDYFQFLPLSSQDELIGFIAFGKKEDNTYLSIDDWELLNSISNSISIAVENALLYSELENQLSELNLLKEFNESIIENINLGIVVLDNMHIIKTWNTFMEYKFRILKENAINNKAYNILGSDIWTKIYTKDKGFVQANEVSVNFGNYEIIFDISFSPLKDNRGHSIGTILVFEDITEKILIQDKLITAEKMASIGMLSAGIAHEINTPLTGISSYCQFILDYPDNSENIQLIKKIQDQVIRANKIVRTLLDFSRQKGEQPMELDVSKLIDESLALIEHKLKKSNIKIIKNINVKSRIFGFSTRLQQLFINLLINSADAMDKEENIIKINGFEKYEEIHIEIIDNGKGIDKNQINKIFEPFFTTKEQGKGTGLGLSISYNIVKEHYGDISVFSEVEKGTKFEIVLPLITPLRRTKK